jgi:hypothetical protein
METFAIMVGFGFVKYTSGHFFVDRTPNEWAAKKFGSKKEAHDFALSYVGDLFEIVEIA